MADEVDIAQKYEEQLRAEGLAHRITYTASTECQDCEEPLEPHRVPFGRCFCCAQALELSGKQYGGR